MTIDINRAYERTMRDEGNDKWLEKHGSAEDVTDSPSHFNKLKQALPKVTKGIEKALKDGRKSKVECQLGSKNYQPSTPTSWLTLA